MNECEIFMAAVDIDSSAQRSAFVDRACRGNRLLRMRIEALLESHSHAESLLEHPAVPASESRPFDRIAESPGAMVGSYKLLEQIGEGGMGVVFRAERSHPVRRTVALKVIKPGMDSRQVIARFAAEQQALALMDHPNIARVLDSGTTNSSRYFVMELVDGKSITQYCDAHRLPLRNRLELFVQICEAVQHAHQKGIIHRDLKPSNVLIALCDGRPAPKIIDFGVAKARGPILTGGTHLTELGQVVGTLEYMSPEQAELDQHDIDTRSDIYSLGTLLYELLTGATPLERKRLKETALLEGLRLIREEEPPRPSDRLIEIESLPSIAANRGLEPKKLIGLVRGELDWIAMKCLEKDRDCRYVSAGSLAADIQHYLRDEPVLACPPSRVYRFGKFARKHRSAIAVACGFAAVLIGAAIVSTLLAIRASQATELATANERRALEKEREALASAEQARQAAQAELLAREKQAAHLKQNEAISRFLSSAFRSPNSTRDDRTITLADVLARSAEEVRVEFEDSPTKVDLLHIIAQAYFDLGLYREAIPLLEEGREYLVQTFGPDHTTTLAYSGNLAVAYKKSGRLNDACQLFEELLERMQRVLGSHRQTRITMVHLGDIYLKEGRLDAALPLLDKSLKLSRARLGPHHPDTLRAMIVLADAYSADSRMVEAFQLYEEWVSRRATALGPDHPKTVRALRTIAKKYATYGRFAEAAGSYARLIQSQPDDSGVALRAALLSLAADDRESYSNICRQMLDRFAHNDSEWAVNRTSLAGLMSSSPVGDLEQLVLLADSAVADFDDSAKLADRVIGYRTRGLAAYRAGDFQGALNWCQKSRDLESTKTSSSSYLATNLVIEAMAWYRLGRPSEAQAAFNESARMIERHFPEAPVNLGAEWFNWLMHDLLRREVVEMLDHERAADVEKTATTSTPPPERDARTAILRMPNGEF